MTTLVERIEEKIIGTVAAWAIAIMLGALTTTIALGQAALEDNTAVMLKYSDSNVQMQAELQGLKKDVGVFTVLVVDIRQSMFSDRLRNLTKQVYKITNDPEDIKAVDVLAASDFCDSTLFREHVVSLSGSERVVTLNSCSSANAWVKSNSA